MPPSIRSMALARYAYDLGVPLPKFLVRIHICEEPDAAAVIASGQCKLDGVPLTDPAMIISSQLIKNGSTVEYGEQVVNLVFWEDGDNGLR